jgi:hypothetical protein
LFTNTTTHVLVGGFANETEQFSIRFIFAFSKEKNASTKREKKQQQQQQQQLTRRRGGGGIRRRRRCAAHSAAAKLCQNARTHAPSIGFEPHKQKKRNIEQRTIARATLGMHFVLISRGNETAFTLTAAAGAFGMQKPFKKKPKTPHDETK